MHYDVGGEGVQDAGVVPSVPTCGIGQAQFAAKLTWFSRFRVNTFKGKISFWKKEKNYWDHIQKWQHTT